MYNYDDLALEYQVARNEADFAEYMYDNAMNKVASIEEELACMEKDAFSVPGWNAVKGFATKTVDKARQVGSKLKYNGELGLAETAKNQLLNKAKANVGTFIKNNPKAALGIAGTAGAAALGGTGYAGYRALKKEAAAADTVRKYVSGKADRIADSMTSSRYNQAMNGGAKGLGKVTYKAKGLVLDAARAAKRNPLVAAGLATAAATGAVGGAGYAGYRALKKKAAVDDSIDWGNLAGGAKRVVGDAGRNLAGMGLGAGVGAGLGALALKGKGAKYMHALGKGLNMRGESRLGQKVIEYANKGGRALGAAVGGAAGLAAGGVASNIYNIQRNINDAAPNLSTPGKVGLGVGNLLFSPANIVTSYAAGAKTNKW